MVLTHTSARQPTQLIISQGSKVTSGGRIITCLPAVFAASVLISTLKPEPEPEPERSWWHRSAGGTGPGGSAYLSLFKASSPVVALACRDSALPLMAAAGGLEAEQDEPSLGALGALVLLLPLLGDSSGFNPAAEGEKSLQVQPASHSSIFLQFLFHSGKTFTGLKGPVVSVLQTPGGHFIP